jgi:hypothetical protein
MRKHVKILGWLQIVLGIIDLVIGGLAFGVLSGVGLMSGEVGGFAMMSTFGGVVAMLMLLLALPNLICGIGLLRNWGGWVIVLAVVLGFLNLVKFPWGTAVAIYTFWIAWKLYDTTPDTGPTT